METTDRAVCSPSTRSTRSVVKELQKDARLVFVTTVGGIEASSRQ